MCSAFTLCSYRHLFQGFTSLILGFEMTKQKESCGVCLLEEWFWRTSYLLHWDSSISLVRTSQGLSSWASCGFSDLFRSSQPWWSWWLLSTQASPSSAWSLKSFASLYSFAGSQVSRQAAAFVKKGFCFSILEGGSWCNQEGKRDRSSLFRIGISRTSLQDLICEERTLCSSQQSGAPGRRKRSRI